MIEAAEAGAKVDIGAQKSAPFEALPVPGPDHLLAQFAGQFFADPLGAALFAFEWGKGELEGIDGPDVWQAAFFDDVGRAVAAGEPVRFATSAGHGIGKGAATAMVLLWLMMTRPNLAGVVTANTKTQLTSKTWRELQVWHNRLIPPLRAWFRWTATRYECRFSPKTWGVDAVPWSEGRSEAFAGLHARHVVVIFDEASAIADVIWQVAKGAMTTAGAMFFAFGNPTRNTGGFHACFMGRDRHRWNKRTIDARTCRFAERAELDRWVEDYGEDSDFVRVRVRGLFPRSAAKQLIGADLVVAARSRVVEPDPGAPLMLGVDVARYGAARSVLAFRQGRDARSIPWQHYSGLSAPELADQIADAITKYRPDAVMIDGGGVGGPVVDELKRRRFKIFEVNFGSKPRDRRKYFNKRAEMWGDIADWIGSAAIPDDDTLGDDLTGPEITHHPADSRIILESKEAMERRGIASPDDGDALALTFAERVARRDPAASDPGRRVARTERPRHVRGAFA